MTKFGFIEYLKRDKKKALILAIVAAVIILFLLISPSNEKNESGVTLDEYKTQLEGELAGLCSSIDGVGRCRVSVSFSEGEQLEYKGSRLVGSSPPRVRGVSVVCEGADRSGVRAEISECMTALFDIGANRVSVHRMK